MKKTLKKITSLLLTLCMVMAMGITSFAASASDTAELKITGIEKDATVTLYQIGTPQYSTKGDTFVKFNYVTGATITEAGPKTDEINAIANGIVGGTITATQVDTATVGQNGEYKYSATAGVYIAIITGGEKTYNPILLAASYNGEGTLTGGSISLPANYLYGDTAVAKSSEPTVDKEITGGTTADADKPTVSVGDIVSYKVTPTLPSYPANATNKTVYITDTMSEGLDFDYSSLAITMTGVTDPIKANANGEFVIKVTEDDQEKEVIVAKSVKTTNGFRLSFVYDEVKGKSPVVTYNARVNENAVVGVDGNPNDVDYFYSNQPNTGNTYDSLDKEPQEGNGLKKKEDSETVYTYEIAFKKTGENDVALPDATFGIYKDSDCTQLVDIVKSNSDGIARSSQVEKGTYYVKEISAPAGYSLNTTVYPVTAEWTSVTSTVTHTATTTEYTSNVNEAKSNVQVGWLKDNKFYSMETYTTETAKTANAVPAYVKTENTTTSSSITIEQGPGAGVVDLGIIKNTKLTSLPSTGGIGTYIFTIVGVIIMVVASGLYFASRKKRA